MRSPLASSLGAVVLAALMVGLASPQRAGAIPLQTLIDTNGYIDSSDKRFDNFQPLTITGWPAPSIDPSQIDVVPFYDPGRDEYGIQFRSLNPPNHTPIISAQAGALVDVLIEFDVTIINRPADWRIHDITLAFAADAPADGFVQVVESALDGAHVVGQAQVQTPAPMTDHVDLDPGVYRKLTIIKDVIAIGGITAPTDIWTIDQTFSQVPEPATLSLLALGGAVVLFRRRRVLRRLAPRASVVILVLAVLTLQPGTASAWTLQELDDGQNILHGDKLFHDFDVQIDSSGLGRVFADPNAIEVQGITVNDEHGLQFGGLIAAMSTLQGPASVTMTIDFDVTVQVPNLWIHDASLSFNGAVTDLVSGSAQIVEDLTGGAGPIAPGPLVVVAPGGPLSDHIEFGAQYDTIHVTKTITLESGTGITTISFVRQTFSQVPEPGTLGLLALGIPVVFRRRRARV